MLNTLFLFHYFRYPFDLDLKNVAVQSGLASRDSNTGDDTNTDTIIDGLGKSVEDSNPDDDFLQELAYYEKVNAWCA